MSSYVITVIGIPVYYHYCGGELEEINYVMNSNSCCDGEEDDAASNDCCKDENLVLKSNVDFTLKNLHDYTFVKTFSELFFISLPFSNSIKPVSDPPVSVYAESPPPKLQNDLIISTSVMRI